MNWITSTATRHPSAFVRVAVPAHFFVIFNETGSELESAASVFVCASKAYWVRRKNALGVDGLIVILVLVIAELPGMLTQLVLIPTLNELVCICKV